MSMDEVVKIIEKYQGIAKERNVVVSDIFAGQQELTDSVGARLRSSYDRINLAIEKLDSKDPDMGEKKHLIQQMKILVPSKYAVTIEDMNVLNDALNMLVALNTSKVEETT